MHQPSYQPTAGDVTASQVEAENMRFIWRVYRWMTLGLAVTGFVSLYVAMTPSIARAVFTNPLLFYGLLGVELIMVWSFSSIAKRASAMVAMALFLSYAAINGVTLSIIFFVYAAESIAQVFFITTATFGAMSAYGSLTKRDLTSIGSFCMMGLMGLIIAMVVNLFLQSSAMGFVISCAGVLIFTGLTAYDTQKIKAMNIIGNEGTEEDTKEALNGALILYLDFINLFLQLLRLMGRRR